MVHNPARRRFTTRILKAIGLLLALFLLYVVVVLLHATLTDYTPEGISELEVEGGEALPVVTDSILSFSLWNLGYGGLGKESDFFYHGAGFFVSGKNMVRSPRNFVDKNNAGAITTIAENKADFILLQEVDYHSRRSYFQNQKENIQQALPHYSNTTAVNFDVNRIPTPIFEPWNLYGEANSGINTFSAYAPTLAQRHQLPGKFSWPNKLFLLDRCLSLQRYPTSRGKELVVINVHNSAYDRDGSIKDQHMNYVKKLVLKEYEAGNYVVVGGDWNQCPPGFDFDTFHPGTKKYSKDPNIPGDFMPDGWQWVFDAEVPTIRSTYEIYRSGKTFTSIIDFFLISPNVELLEVKGVDQGFDFSDHQMVNMQIRLK